MTRAGSILRVLVAVALLSSLSMPVLADEDGSSGEIIESETGALVVAGEYLLWFGTTPPPSRLASMLAGSNIEHLGSGVYRLVEVATTRPVARADELSELFGTTVVPNGVTRLLGDNPEPDADSQWHLDNYAQFVGGVADADIDAEQAWDAATGAGVVVAVIDSGADLDSLDLAANIWVNNAEIAGNGIDDDANGFIDDSMGWDFWGNDNDPEDSGLSGHGTAVAALIAAPVDGHGTAGVAFNSKIMVLRVCGFSLCDDAATIEAIHYAAANGADVINLSLGGPPREDDDAMRIAIQAAIDAGVVVLAAAGNDGTNNDVAPINPASFGIPGLVSIAMTDHADKIDPGSNYGASSVHVGAPGSSVWVVDLGDSNYFGTGTSFAAPMATGVAALIREHRGCYSATDIATVIETTGDPSPSLAGVTISGKRINAFNALAVEVVAGGVVVAPMPAAVSFSGGTAGTTWTFGDGDSTVGESAQHVYGLGLFSADDGTSTYEIASGLDFTDTCDSTFLIEIMWLSASGITAGCDGAPSFCPNLTLSRMQMASLLANALNLPPASQDYFDDDDGLAHEDNINRLREAEITFGCQAGTAEFCPWKTFRECRWRHFWSAP